MNELDDDMLDEGPLECDLEEFGDDWPKYRVVFAAGFGAGMGLITMFALGFVFMAKSANVLPI